jgi:threonine/homoserine/homoserine lactone efflux protein
VPDPSSWFVFVVAAVALLVTPGPAVLYVITRSLGEGRRAGLVSVAGIGVGTLGHVLAATLGVSALLASSATAFMVVKLAGGAYLVWLGIRRIVSKDSAGPRSALVAAGNWAIFRQGAVVNLLNPKTALFFLAFLPQFVDPRHAVAPQMLALGLTFAALGLTSDACFALLAGSVRQALARGRGRRVMVAQRYLTGGVFVALGITAALTRPAS